MKVIGENKGDGLIVTLIKEEKWTQGYTLAGQLIKMSCIIQKMMIKIKHNAAKLLKELSHKHWYNVFLRPKHWKWVRGLCLCWLNYMHACITHCTLLGVLRVQFRKAWGFNKHRQLTKGVCYFAHRSRLLYFRKKLATSRSNAANQKYIIKSECKYNNYDVLS